MYTIIFGKYEGFTYDAEDTLECADIDELTALISELRYEGYRIFIVSKGGVECARVDDIAAVINAQIKALSSLE